MSKARLMGLVALSASLAASVSVYAADDQPTWKTGGFDAPESVVYDDASGSLFVSNINGGDFTAKDGNGYISKLDVDGNVVAREWVGGLNSPKGLDIANGHLFVADVEQLVEVDLSSGEVLKRYDAPGAVLLNDVVAAPDGRIFASATLQNAIYQLIDGEFTIFLQDAALEGPNGLLVEQDKLIVASVGDLSNGFDKRQPSNIKVVDLGTKQVSEFGSPEPIGGLDGLQPAGGGAYFVTDFFAGGLMKVTGDGAVQPILQLNSGSADFDYASSTGMAYIPLMNDGEVAAFKIGN